MIALDLCSAAKVLASRQHTRLGEQDQCSTALLRVQLLCSVRCVRTGDCADFAADVDLVGFL